jgi:hypothetical protein
VLLEDRRFFDMASIDELAASVECAAMSGKAPSSAVRLSVAVNRSGVVGLKPWGDVINAILDRSVPVWRMDTRFVGVLKEYGTTHLDALELILSRKSSTITSVNEDEFITASEAADTGCKYQR